MRLRFWRRGGEEPTHVELIPPAPPDHPLVGRRFAVISRSLTIWTDVRPEDQTRELTDDERREMNRKLREAMRRP